MENLMKDLHEMCETIARAINTANEKIRAAGGKVTSADMDYLDKLTHSLKSIKTTIAMMEAEQDDGSEYSERYYRDGGSYRRGYSREGGSYRGSYGDSYNDGGSYARGRGRNARRDSMGRYSSDGSYGRDYSRDGGNMADELRDLMEQAPDEQTRQEMQRLVQKLEQR